MIRRVDGSEVQSQEEIECTDWPRFEAHVQQVVESQRRKSTAESAVRYIVVEGYTLLHSDVVAATCDHVFYIDTHRGKRHHRPAPHSHLPPNLRPESREYCEKVLWPAHIENVAQSVRTRPNVVHLEGGDEAA